MVKIIAFAKIYTWRNSIQKKPQSQLYNSQMVSLMLAFSKPNATPVSTAAYPIKTAMA